MRVTAPRPAIWSLSCSRSGIRWPPAARCRRALRGRARCGQRQPGQGVPGRVPRDLDRAHGRGYYRRLHYLMCDYSQHVLDLAEGDRRRSRRPRQLAPAGRHPAADLAGLPARPGLPALHLERLRQPADRRGRTARRPYLPGADPRRTCPPAAAARASGLGVGRARRPPGAGAQAAAARPGPACRTPRPPTSATSRRRSGSGSEHGRCSGWRNATSRSPALTSTRSRPSVSGEMLRPLLESGADIRMHVSNGAWPALSTASPLLHPFGKLVCHDLFVTDVRAATARVSAARASTTARS